MKGKEITIYDIATKLGLSPSTVSRGLKGHYTVSQKTQRKIASTAESMGYRFNTFAASLRSSRTNTIGVVVPRLNSYFMSQVIAGIEKVLSEAGYNLLISQSLEDVNKEIRNVKTMFNSRVDALLVSLASDTKELSHFDVFTERGVPLLFFDRIPGKHTAPAISIDNEQAAYEVTKHLIQQGAKTIIHITGNQLRNVYADRLKGYKRALSAAKLKFSPDHVIINDLSETSGIAAAAKLKALKADAVFVANDSCAASCMKEAKRLGLRVPDDVMFAGFNNDMISRNVEPALTTVDYPGIEMGELAARNLLAHLDERIDLNLMKDILLKTRLLVRESSSKS
ncbi:LacI family transcriptional regulator [Chitinophaga horti]|uniref:LacI family transcriptional regulator n=1 Tax=Chitinophaga horti TaxID=2920382 RepID=A0ABY6J0C3_9BACT|nr:LacI family DNA-binding transcriptional regulator [Chitinophaga horti]UYQ91689.1 LacI family transcriptional regulator [Chitinophaga horti]